jgi:lipopolysaccharide export system protein LptA
MRHSRIVLLCLALAGGLMLLTPPDADAASRRHSGRTRQASDRTSGQTSSQAPGNTPARPSASAKGIPTRITADGMTYEADAQQVTFTKNVHVIRADFELWSDTLTVFLKPAKKKETGEEGVPAPVPATADSLAAGDIDHIVAMGNVRMKRDKHSSTSAKATYTMDTALLELEGNPRLTDGENVITGEQVRYFMNENRSEVSGGPKKQVEAVFTTSDKPTREGGR